MLTSATGGELPRNYSATLRRALFRSLLLRTTFVRSIARAQRLRAPEPFTCPVEWTKKAALAGGGQLGMRLSRARG